MERILEGLKPEKVFYYFEEISRIPRGSGNEKAVSDYLVCFAKEHGFKVTRDDSLNVAISKPATPGYEDRPGIILQGHMDMVCVKDPGVEHDFEKDPIPMAVKDGYIYAEGTTLGADDGNALALALAILDNDEIKHPPLQAVFTVEEEIGLFGAARIDASMIEGDYLIGLDYSGEKDILVSCAGNSNNIFLIPAKKTPVGNGAECCAKKAGSGMQALRVAVGGLTSGHSGSQIICGFANANRLLGEILNALAGECKIKIAEINGGSKMNAIPAEAEAVILCPADQAQKAKEIFDSAAPALKKEYRETDPGMTLSCEETELPSECWPDRATEQTLALLALIPNGVQNYLDKERTMVKSSGNLATIRETEEGIELLSMVRSNSEYEHDQIIRRLSRLAELAGVGFRSVNRMPGWEYDPQSRFVTKIQDIWEEARGFRPPVSVTHGGVEAGILIDKMKERGRKLEAINMGINGDGAHTTSERVEIASLGRTYDLLIRILEQIR